MPSTTVSHSFFDIQIRITTTQRLSVLQVVLAWIRMDPDLVRKVLEVLQESWLEEDLGPHGSVGTLFGQKKFACPEGESGRAIRKDFKDRHPVVPVPGEITVPERRVTCQECGSVYRPYEEVLGLPKHKQYTMEALVEGLRHALVTSYERAATFMQASASPNTLHRTIQKTQPTPEGTDAEYALVVVDATDVPKWRESDQITLTLAHEVEEGPQEHGRSTLKHQLVAVASGSEDDIKTMLEEPKIEALMHDGKLEGRRIV